MHVYTCTRVHSENQRRERIREIPSNYLKFLLLLLICFFMFLILCYSLSSDFVIPAAHDV